MTLLNEYKKNPCGALPIPYWKNQQITLSSNMKIVHNSDFNERLLEAYTDETYFRLSHPLNNIPEYNVPHIKIEVIPPTRKNDLAALINASYTHLGITVTSQDIEKWMESEVYCPCLWTGAFLEDKLIGAVISENDRNLGEGIIEWLQVLPEYRKCNVALSLLSKSLNKMSKIAQFATVSGKCDNITMPEKVYRKIGFEGNDIWHILTKRKS